MIHRLKALSDEITDERNVAKPRLDEWPEVIEADRFEEIEEASSLVEKLGGPRPIGSEK